MKKIFIIHGYNGVPKVNNWLKENLSKNYEVIMPEFQLRENARYDNWKKVFDKYKDKIDEDSIFIGHSLGSEFIIKYISENNLKIKLYISLAGFCKYFEHEGRDDLNKAGKDFLVNEEEINKFKENTINRYCIYSNDDHIVPFDILELFPKVIDAKPIMIENIGHMGRKSGLESLPKVIDIINNEVD